MPIISRRIATYSLACICAAAGFIGAYMATGTHAAETYCTQHPKRCHPTNPPTTTAVTTSTTSSTPTTTTTPPTTTTRRRPPVTTTTTTTTAPTTTTTQTTPSPGTGTSAPGQLFNGDFETGSYKPWGTPQCANFGASSASRTFGNLQVSSPGGQGSYAGTFSLPADSSQRTRCELLTPRSINNGGDDYYSLMVNLPSGFNPGTNVGGVMIAQLNWEGMPGAPVELHAYSDHVTVRVDSGTCGANNTSVPCQYYSDADAKQTNVPSIYAIPAPMQTGVWHELVIHVHWATNSTGKVEVWHRIKGQGSWTQTASLSGYPTLAVDSSGNYPSGTGDKIGAYRAQSSSPTSVTLDGFTRAGSFNSAAAVLP